MTTNTAHIRDNRNSLKTVCGAAPDIWDVDYVVGGYPAGSRLTVCEHCNCIVKGRQTRALRGAKRREQRQ